eukprot:363982-Chlamydomonas_euryale.AAC.2
MVRGAGESRRLSCGVPQPRLQLLRRTPPSPPSLLPSPLLCSSTPCLLFAPSLLRPSVHPLPLFPLSPSLPAFPLSCHSSRSPPSSASLQLPPQSFLPPPKNLMAIDERAGKGIPSCPGSPSIPINPRQLHCASLPPCPLGLNVALNPAWAP